MGRFLFVTLVLLGIGYGGWSLFSGDDDSASLSAEAPTDPGGTGGAAGAGAEAAPTGDAPVGAGAATAASAAAEPADVEAWIDQAKNALDRAAKATTRGVALEDKDRARRLLSRAFFATADAGLARELKGRVDALNEEVLFSEEPLEGKAFLHTFLPTDRLWTLCNRTWPKERNLHIEPGFLLWVNGLSDARLIREGQVLKVPTEELSLLVSKSRFRLWVLLGDVYVREFTIGIGVNDKTPEGDFEIDTKIEKPDWYYEGRKIPFGSPENPLGTRWMGFKRTPRAAGYGIHGTKEPGSVGKAVSQGCIRMENEDVEELFTWVARGTRVRILR